MSAKSAKQKQSELRDRRRAAGFRQLAEWVHEEDRAAVIAFCKEARRVRFNLLKLRARQK